MEVAYIPLGLVYLCFGLYPRGALGVGGGGRRKYVAALFGGCGQISAIFYRVFEQQKTKNRTKKVEEEKKQHFVWPIFFGVIFFLTPLCLKKRDKKMQIK
jgi:hypothetical protein